ncbi:MAG: LLM class F420-dependent oxidoreductase, partial [Solirubrobacteraceae bacterium]
ATFDAFALATAVGDRTDGLALKIGPLAVGVRSPVAIALAASSVATLICRPVGVALGASSPVIVTGWHDRPWDGLALRMRETVLALRSLLAGERIQFDGERVRAHGFKLRRPQPGSSITVAAFGPEMTRVAARHADEVVLNLVTPEHVAAVRHRIDEEAAAVGQPAPRLAVWVPAALEPEEAALAQLGGQLAVYLGAPGYGEMFGRLGFGSLVDRARAGARRAELASAMPADLVAQIGALGSVHELAARVAAYGQAGADHVGIVPATAEDPAGARVMAALVGDAVAREGVAG